MREVSVGENLDQYKLIEVIARSGMASIFKAVDGDSGVQRVALRFRTRSWRATLSLMPASSARRR